VALGGAEVEGEIADVEDSILRVQITRKRDGLVPKGSVAVWAATAATDLDSEMALRLGSQQMSDAQHPRVDEEIQRFCDHMVRALVIGESIVAALNRGEWSDELLRRDMWHRQTGTEALERLQHRAPAMMFQTSLRARLVREVLVAGKAFREK
jgi:hypothetical protein